MKQVTINDKTCKFYPDSHTYRVDGEVIPGVTSITGIKDKSGPFLGAATKIIKQWIEDNLEPGKRYSEDEVTEFAELARYSYKREWNKKAKLGTVVHEYAEDFIKSKIHGTEEPDYPVNREAKKSVDQFLAWWNNYDIVPWNSEKMVWYPEENYAGTLDLVASVDGTLTVIDFKTSKALYPEYDMQVVAYLKAANQMADREIKGYGLLRFPKEHVGFDSKFSTDQKKIEDHWQGFLSAKGLYEWNERYG